MSRKNILGKTRENIAGKEYSETTRETYRQERIIRDIQTSWPGKNIQGIQIFKVRKEYSGTTTKRHMVRKNIQGQPARHMVRK